MGWKGVGMAWHRVTMRRTFLIVVACTAWSATRALGSGENMPAKKNTTAATRQAGLGAWQQVYSVLTHPRCINCHTATNYPQQGDDRHRHLFNVVRGPGDKGVPGLNCSTCHESANADSTGVPGGHNWHLAPLSIKWQDLNDRALPSTEVCRSVKSQLDGAHLLKHHEEEPLVLWAWNPGRRPDGSIRTLPPLTHAQFVEATRQWVKAGRPCP